MFIGWENGLGEHLGRATWESSLRGVVNVKNKVKKSIQCVEKLGRVQWKSSLREQYWREGRGAWKSSQKIL